MTRKYTTYDEHMREELKDPEDAQMYLDVALEEYEKDGDFAAFLIALRRVVEIHGNMTDVSRRSDLSRRGLYKTLSADGHPRLDTVGAILLTMGFRLSVTRVGA